mmetsp:Transcript_139181/g.242217  ORF Transcript_139181/g.242217 Transcript_139181/m.242217 type:complete len:264 (+) Transcript_139181:78-869(+)
MFRKGQELPSILTARSKEPWTSRERWQRPPSPSLAATPRRQVENPFDPAELLSNRRELPYHAKADVSTAKYVPTRNVVTSGAPASTMRSTSTIGSRSFNETTISSARSHKCEAWREKGMERWPPVAASEMLRQPRQFVKAEEVIPLQRTVENPQGNILGDMWCRSLRKKRLRAESIGLHNQNICTATVGVMFDHDGHGWSGKTNTRGGARTRPGKYGPHLEDWIERPVAHGKYGLTHMSGSRYALDQTPRDVCDTVEGPRTAR